MTDLSRRATLAIGWLVFLFTTAIYLITLTPTVPFWDSGEFIAVSNILGIPHPPGTPLYVLLGRIATLFPIATLAQRVNGLSALASSLAVLLTYLTTLRLIRLAQGAERTPTKEWIAQAGAVCGALMLAFSDNFWENAIEAEVYSLMSLAQILVLWLGLKWWEDHEKRPTAGPLLVCVYVMWLSVGVHLGVGMMGLPLLLLVMLVDRKAALVFMMPLLSVLGVTFGLEKMAGIVLVLSMATFLAYSWQRKLEGWVAWGAVVPAMIGMYYAFGDKDFTPVSAVIASAAVIVPLVMLARRTREGRILALAFGLMVIGYSTHLYLPIRAAQHPAINEGNPSNWERMRDLLERRQYGHTSMFVRRAPLSAQLDKEFWRYWNRQWPVFGNLKTVGPQPGHAEPLPWQVALPLLLGLAGMAWQARRERISFLTTASLVAFGTVVMIVFLNFTANEVRDRDYFFTTGYHAFALWIGMGAAWLIAWVMDSFAEPRMRRMIGITAGVLMVAMPFMLMKVLWYFHDRRGNYVARDYAFNMLEPLAPNSYVFTNGDNDTFPLWYMQQVENFRRDVRVVNLSLLNTDWYIQQLRDDPPKLPMDLTDPEIRLLGGGAVQDSTGRVIMTNQFMVGHLVDHSRRGAGWIQQPYFAVTVPEHMGLDPFFTLEALVYRVDPDSLHENFDPVATRRQLYQEFKYRGLFNADGSWNDKVYKDENASTLSRNYAAAHLQLAFFYRRHNQLDNAIAEMERVGRMFPNYTEIQVPLGEFYMERRDTLKAMELFHSLVGSAPGNPEVHYYYGVTLVFRGRLEEAVHEFDAAIQLEPGYSQPYYGAYYALMQLGKREQALGYLQRIVNASPGDTQAQQLLRMQTGRASGGPGLMPRPPVPNLP